MMTKEQLKQKYEAFHEHFNFKDFLGLSALVFGLLLSNSSLESVTAKTEQPPLPTTLEKEAAPIKKNMKKKGSKKKVIKSKKKRQQVTAAHKK